MNALAIAVLIADGLGALALVAVAGAYVRGRRDLRRLLEQLASEERELASDRRGTAGGKVLGSQDELAEGSLKEDARASARRWPFRRSAGGT